MATKQEERRANAQKTEDLKNSLNPQQPISRETGIDYPLTNPAAKQQADRLNQEKEGAFSKPFPTGSNLSSQPGTATEPAAQSDAEFKETGGEKVTADNPAPAPEDTSKTEGTTAKKSDKK